MKRLAAAAALLLILGSSVRAEAASLQPLDPDGLNLRAGPGLGFAVQDVLKGGQRAALLEQQGQWYKVRTEGGREYWVAGWFSRIDYSSDQIFATVTGDVVNVRHDPSLTSTVLTLIRQNQQVQVLETAGIWWRVRLSTGYEGWVFSQYLQRVTALPAVPPLVAQPVPPVAVKPGGGLPPPPPAPLPAPKPAPVPAPDPVPAVPPAAPPGTVPVLAAEKLAPVFPVGAKTVMATALAGVYQGRDTGAYDQYDTVKAGEALRFLDSAEGWVKVATPRGNVGWMPGRAARVTEGGLTYDIDAGRWAISIAASTPVSAPKLPAPAPAAAPQPAKRVVRDADGLRMRESPSLDGKIITVLPKGAVLEVLETQAPWLKVKTEAHGSGWVDGDYTAPLPSTPSTPSTPTIPAPAPASPAAGAKVTLTVPTPGVLRLTVDGNGAAPGDPVEDGSTLRIPLVTGQTGTAYLPVAFGGADALSVGPTGFGLVLDAIGSWQVTARSGTTLTIEMKPALKSVTVQELPDRTVYALQVAGPVAPRASASGPDTMVDLPGAVAAVTALPSGVRLTNTGSGVRLSVSSRRAYALKRTGQGFELHLYRSGLAGKTIVLDPGHGGGDPGAGNAQLGVREKEVNLAVALRLRALLAAKGATVLMTRATDAWPAPADLMRGAADPVHVDLHYRTRIANELKADLFLSIHHNAGTGSGSEDYYSSGTLNGGRAGTLAGLLQGAMVAATKQVNRGSFDDMMYVTLNTDAPATLVEVGFITNPVEGAAAKTAAYQQKVAQALAQAIESFYAERTD